MDTLTQAARDAPPATVSRGQDGRASFERLYADSRDALYAYVMGIIRDPAAAEEVTAQAFERAWRKRRTIDRRRGDARAWLFGIARNAALDDLRRRSRHAHPVDPAELSEYPGDGDPVEPAERIALETAVAGLPVRDRELIALKFHSGLNNREIAKVTGYSESNVGTRLCRIVAALRDAL